MRHNLLALGVDLALFLVGFSFVSPSTILPAFAAHLGAPNVIIGAIPALMAVGLLLPSLFAAGHAEALTRKLPFVLRYTIWERAPFLVLALAAFVLADAAPTLTLALLLIMLVVITGTGGVLMPAWMDIVGRAVPMNLRGRFFAAANVLASAGGLAGTFATTSILEVLPAPAGYGVCFLLSAFFMALSYVALALTREPVAAARSPAPPLRVHLARVPALLRDNPNLSWFLTARAFGIFGMMASVFYAVYALRAYAAPISQVGVFTTALFSGQLAGNLVFGWLADRTGHRLVIITGMAATVGANIAALAAPSLGLFSLVFALSGVQLAAISVSHLAVLLEFAPAAGEHPTYVGLGSTLLAPPTFAAPLLAGVMADALGFQAVFIAATVCGVIGLGLLIARVQDPRRERAMS